MTGRYGLVFCSMIQADGCSVGDAFSERRVEAQGCSAR